MPNRIVKESIWGSESLSKVSLYASSFFLRLLPFPDDHGCFDARPAILRARLYPLMLDRVLEEDIAVWLSELQSIDCVRLWVGEDGIKYGLIPAWSKHQQIRSIHRRKTPEPPEAVVSGGNNLQSIDSKRKQVNTIDALNPNPNLNPLVKTNIVELPENTATSTIQEPDHIVDANKMVDQETNQHADSKTPEKTPIRPAIEILDGHPTQPINDCVKVNLSESDEESSLEFAGQVIDDLNQVVMAKYKSNNKNTIAAINARRKEGFTLDDFKAVHRKKAKQWLDDPKMAQYLRPDTLYRPGKFEGYLNEKEVSGLSKDPNRKLTVREKNWAVLDEYIRSDTGGNTTKSIC